MSLIVLWKHIIVGAWVKIKMSGGERTVVYCTLSLTVMHGYRTKPV